MAAGLWDGTHLPIRLGLTPGLLFPSVRPQTLRDADGQTEWRGEMRRETAKVVLLFDKVVDKRKMLIYRNIFGEC